LFRSPRYRFDWSASRPVESPALPRWLSLLLLSLKSVDIPDR
jgi:hypothetical protein